MSTTEELVIEESQKVCFDDGPAFLNEKPIESIWPWRVIVGKIFYYHVGFIFCESISKIL